MNRTFLLFILANIVMTAASAYTIDLGSLVVGSDTVSTIVVDPAAKKDKSKSRIKPYTADHIMIEYGLDGWFGNTVGINTKGFSRHFNAYFMLDNPFKKNPHYSVGVGLGIGSSNIFFDKMFVDIKSDKSQLPFIDQTVDKHFNKFKLTTLFAELPVELRYFSDPQNMNTSWKGAIGIKIGTLLKAYTKGKDWQNSNGSTVYGNSYIVKESSKQFFTTTKIAATARVGYGIYSVHVDVQLTPVIKNGLGPTLNPYSIGFAVSGL